MKSILVKFENGRIEFYPSAKQAAKAWGCSGQAVLNMMHKCEGNNSKFPLRNSLIATELGIVAVVNVENIEDFNKYDDFGIKWINGKS